MQNQDEMVFGVIRWDDPYLFFGLRLSKVVLSRLTKAFSMHLAERTEMRAFCRSGEEIPQMSYAIFLLKPSTLHSVC